HPLRAGHGGAVPRGGGGDAVSYVDHPYEELGVYALDALEPGERRIIEAHLAICAQCTAEVATHRAVLAALTEDEPPPPAIWARIARDIGADDLPTPLPSGPARRDTLRPYPVPPAPGPPPHCVPPRPPRAAPPGCRRPPPPRRTACPPAHRPSRSARRTCAPGAPTSGAGGLSP